MDGRVGGMMRFAGAGLLVLMLAAGAWSSPTCMQFLRLSTLPRVSAMGEAAAAVRDATWAEANPSHLTSMDGTLITFSHTSWFEDISLESLTMGTSSGKQAFGISVVGLHTDPLDEYDAVGRYLGSFRYFDFFVSGSYARALTPSLSVGITGKTLYEKIGWDAATGLAIDLGLGYTVPMRLARGGLSAGLVMRNLGTEMGYHDESFPLPLTWQGGVSYEPMWLPPYMQGVVALAYEKTRDRDGGMLAGLEIGLSDIVAVRLGHRGTYDNGDLTFGVGLALAGTSVDYAYVDLGENLGGTHRVSLGFKVGAIFPSP
ncbi:MAG: PorV/PorQ family protein [Candidatus Eisenbacteria bacterium]